MVFSSTVFLFVFLPVTLAGYYLLPKRLRNCFLLLASLLFYTCGEPRFVFVMLGSIYVNYCFAIAIESAKSKHKLTAAKTTLIFAVIFNLSLFFIFKYLNFTIQNANRIYQIFSGDSNILLKQTNIALPIGISFFTFQAMSYVFDVYNGTGEVQKKFMNVALYVSLFPQLIAGPIVRYQTVADEIKSRRENLNDFEKGIRRFLIGMSKKAIIANTVAVAADYVYALAGEDLTTGLAWLGSLSYSLQIYFDFSGYSDMAIGLGLMFGFHFLENFEHPYCSVTVSEFWRRWHISLGSWFRDYIYFPLGGSRVKRGRLVLNLFLVWILTGIWHGANWTFVAWGLFYFLLLTFEKLTNVEKHLHKAVPRFLYRVFTLLCVNFGWVLFRSASISSACVHFKAMLGLSQGGLSDAMTGWMWAQYAAVLVLSMLCCIDWASVLKKGPAQILVSEKGSALRNTCRDAIILAVGILAVSITVASTYNPFIYFNF